MMRGERGQALVLLLGGLAAVLIGAFVLGAIAQGVGAKGGAQRAADLGALAGARAMQQAWPRLFEPATIGGVPNPRHLTRAAYLSLARRAALGAARANGAEVARTTFAGDDGIAATRIRVGVGRAFEVSAGGPRRQVAIEATAEAELAVGAGAALPTAAAGDGYHGSLAYRQGKPMRPDVARAFDRMAEAAARDGLALLVTSGYRSDAEQAELYRRHPDPTWVAPPGKSLHRLGTELDLGPPGAYGWLAGHARRFGFVQRYSWEPWHYGFTLNAGTSSVGFGGGDGSRAIPAFVPDRYAGPLARAAQRWNVSAALLAAQIFVESGFNPFAVSDAGAQGIAQFMPGTARGYGLADAFDAPRAIDAQGHLMRDLLREFGAVPLALAAYNAGPRRVRACGCVPPIQETQGYVARILGMLGGAGDMTAGGLSIRLVR
jgi:hypothetical protein